jgi:ElaB/YqjD/DUF883 family membrane-anchored ribosome-binding protein
METHFPTLAMPQTRRARERLARDLRSLARDAEKLLHATVEDVGDNTQEARKRLRGVLERVKETCEDARDRALASAREAVTQTDRTVRAYPYQALGIALGTGVLIGLLLRRERHTDY